MQKFLSKRNSFAQRIHNTLSRTVYIFAYRIEINSAHSPYSSPGREVRVTASNGYGARRARQGIKCNEISFKFEVKPILNADIVTVDGALCTV